MMDPSPDHYCSMMMGALVGMGRDGQGHWSWGTVVTEMVPLEGGT